jgi:exopolysaccharide production protein ExoZ
MHNPALAAQRNAPDEKSRGTVISIQFLRFIAAALVVFDHAIGGINQHFPGSVSNALLENAFFGASGVHIFFVISGFVMVYTSFYNKDPNAFSPAAFLSRRAIRIYPIYILCCALYIYFDHSFLHAPLLPVVELVRSILLVPGDSAKIIGPGWTLAFEVYFYFCFSIAMILGLKRGMWALTFFFLASLALRLFVDTSVQYIHILTNPLLLEFLLGAWLGYAIVSKIHIGKVGALVLVALAIVWFMSGILFGLKRLPAVLMWGGPSAMLVAGAVFAEGNRQIPSLIRKLSFLGDSSYSLYLMHVLLIDIAIVLALNFSPSIKTWAQHAGSFAIILVCFVIVLYCIAVGLVFYEVIERKMVRNLKRFVRPRGRTESPR